MANHTAGPGTTTEHDVKPRSRDVTDGMERAAARGMLRAVGMTDDDFSKPQIGVASSWNEITPCNLSLDRLAQAGLVRRQPDPRDRRGVLVTLTDLGRSKADDALADLLGRERALLASLGPGDQETLAGLLRTLLAPFDAAPPE